MKKLVVAIAASACAAAFAQSPTEDPVPVRLAHLSLPQQAREHIQAKADEGITALSHYLELTRTVYQVRLMDIVTGLDMSSVSLGDAASTDREIEKALREGRARPAR
jgi:hypothetical protein